MMRWHRHREAIRRAASVALMAALCVLLAHDQAAAFQSFSFLGIFENHHVAITVDALTAARYPACVYDHVGDANTQVDRREMTLSRSSPYIIPNALYDSSHHF